MKKSSVFKVLTPKRRDGVKGEVKSKRQRMLEACGFSQTELSDMVAAMMG